MITSCLLIDDDVDQHFFFDLAINDLDPTIHCHYESTCSDALEYLSVRATGTPDLIFLDLNLPGESGKDCLVAIKQMERLKEIPIVIFSTASIPEDIDETQRLGAAGYIEKPGSLLALVNLLGKAIQKVLNNSNEHFFIKEGFQ